MKVIVIEDEQSIIDAINLAFEFRWQGVTLLSAASGKEGIALVRNESPDVVILDINLPDISGFDVLKQVREFSAVPVIILTVRSEDEDMLRGLETGADDYVIKPFNYLNLLARVKAVLRRADKAPLNIKQYSAISSRIKIDFVNQKVFLDEKAIELTPREYRLLVMLVKNKGKLIKYKEILREIWGKSRTDDNGNIRIYIRRLRKKLQDNPPDIILNKRGTGYMFNG
ncbi:MAG: response regulator transcription factor [Dehalococcoidales bacterium]|nr:response regulator transcription factor [Dehalococcoidales bacterium]